MVDKRHVALVLLALSASPAWGQASEAPRPSGGVDPTENVKALNAAEAKRQDDLRLAEARFQNSLRELEVSKQKELRDADIRRIADLRETDIRRLNELREAETRRVNELATQKQIFDLELARVIRVGLDASTLLLATQLKEVKTDASDRMAKLEQFANEQRGRASADLPAYNQLLSEVRSLTQSRATTSGVDTGISTTWALIGTIIVIMLMFAGLLVAFFNMNKSNKETRA